VRGDLPLVVVPDRVDAGAQVLDGDSTDALCLYLRVFGAHEGVDMPPDVRAEVTAAVDNAADMLLRLSDAYNGLANYLRLRADGARRIDTDDLADDVFAYLLGHGPSRRVLRIPDPLGIDRRDLAGLQTALKGVELKADLPANGAEGARNHIRQLERRLEATTDVAARARLGNELTRARRTLTAYEQWAKGSRAYGVPAQILGTAAAIADGENPARAAGEAGLSGLLARAGARLAPAAGRGAGGIAAGLIASVAGEVGVDALDPTPEQHEYGSPDELLDEIERDMPGLRERHPEEAGAIGGQHLG
jgi:hypothetical protein